jgi:hypothetical protein
MFPLSRDVPVIALQKTIWSKFGHFSVADFGLLPKWRK